MVINTGPTLFYDLYQEPGGPVIGRLSRNAPLLDLYEQMIYEGHLWSRVMDEEGRIGWFPLRFMIYPSPTPIEP